MPPKDGLELVWFMNLGIPLLLLGFAYGCGGDAVIVPSGNTAPQSTTLRGTPIRPAATAIDGRASAQQLAKRWDPEALLIRVDGLDVNLDGRLAETSTSQWSYAFYRPKDGMFFHVKLDGRGTLVGKSSLMPLVQSQWVDPLDRWVIDSPVIAQLVSQIRLPVGRDLDMQLTRNGVWRLIGEGGRYLQEVQVDATTGRRIL